jgi:hypothetical protein
VASGADLVGNPDGAVCRGGGNGAERYQRGVWSSDISFVACGSGKRCGGTYGQISSDKMALMIPNLRLALH